MKTYISDISLRTLKEKDVFGMLEWIHDSRINQFFQFDAENITLEKAEEFVKNSIVDAEEQRGYNYAVVDIKDEYLGTISLKNIDWNAKTAEYAIGLRSMAQGKGIAYAATRQLLEIAFEKLQLNRVFLNVLSDNEKAICFYEKIGFVYEGEFRKHLFLKGEVKNLKWYGMLREEYLIKNF